MLYPSLVDVDSLGRIYILNPVESEVVVFDSDGGFLWSVGQEGEGPGELKSPISVSSEADGTVWVFDSGKRALVGFQRDGTNLPQKPFPFSTIHISLDHVEAGESGFAVWALDPFAGSDVRARRFLWAQARDTTELLKTMSPGRTTARYPECGMTFTLSKPFAPGISWSQRGDRLAVAIWPDYRVDLFEGSDHQRSLRRAVDPILLDQGEAVRRLRAMGVIGPCNTTPEELVRRHGFADRIQIPRRVTLGWDGVVWVQRQDDDGRIRVDRFDPDGSYSGTLPPGFPFPDEILPDGRFLVFVEDSLGVQRIATVRPGIQGDG